MSYIVGLNIIASENAARNILVAGGHAETKNGQVGQHKTTAKVAAACEMSSFQGLRLGRFPMANSRGGCQ